jgi:ERF superfamily
MNRSESINELAAALSKAQGEYEAATKDQNNPNFNRRYADLASGLNACRAALSKNGIAVIQDPTVDMFGEGESEAANVSVETQLVHSSGQWISGTLVMPVEGVTAQKIGSAITYARRYALFALVGIAPEDDDGNAASAGQGAPQQRPAQQSAAPRPGTAAASKRAKTAEQSSVLKSLTRELGFKTPAESEAICRKVTGEGPAALHFDSAKLLIEHMQTMVLNRGKAVPKEPHVVPEDGIDELAQNDNDAPPDNG